MGIMMEDVVELVAHKCFGSLVPGNTDSKALHRWILKFGEDSNKLHISVEMFAD